MHDDNTLARSNRIDEICDRFEQAWASCDRRDIETVLAENPDVDRGQLLRELIRLEMELRRRSGEDPAPGEYERRFPDHGITVGHDIDDTVLRQPTGQKRSETVDVSFHPDTETVTTGDLSGESTFLHGDSTTQPAGDAVDTGTKRFGDYELLHEIARGGMGVVYKARQTKLNRVVALKMIKAGELAGELDVQRFHAEAEAAAQLDHPGIVPIYEVGEQSGQHFFSMGLVEGEGLDTKLKDGPLPAKEAAKLIAEIAGAVQFAHDKGIVHRDLKPANVLIDADGAPKITDFGLAKNISGDSGLTATGQVMGTPSYMPPEQAAGRVDEIGPLADVYSLGAMLYALLTGRPPFQAANVMETLQQVLERDPVSPRTLNPAVDRDLETICLKSLEKDPAKRYATAGEFAGDIGRYLENKPIIARPIGKPARVWRWCKRNPLGATVVALLLFLAVAGPTVAAIQIDTNRRLDAALAGEKEATATAEAKERETAAALARVKVALASEQAALKRKDRALLETMDSIDAYVKVVKNAKLLKDPRFKGLLRDLLKDALAHYQRFVKEHEGEEDKEIRARVVRALYDIGFISHEKGSKNEAIRAYQQALTIQKRLARENSTVTVYQIGLATCYNDLAILYKQTGKPSEALLAYQQAQRIRERIASENPDETEYQNDLAASYNNLGNLYEATGKSAAALATYKQALAIWERLARENPKATAYQRNLAIIHSSVGIHYRKNGKMSRTLTAYRRALKIRQRLARENPAATDFQNELAASYYNLSVLYENTGEHDKARAAQREALTIQQRLARENPTVTKYQSHLATSYNRLGIHYTRLGKHDQASAAYRHALVIRERLARENPTVTLYQNDLAASYNSLGILYKQMGEHNKATAAYRQALTIRERLAHENPTVTLYQNDLAASYNNLGIFYKQVGKRNQANAAYQNALAILKRLARENPAVIKYQNDLAASYNNVGSLYRESGKSTEALAAFQEALAIWERLSRANPDAISYQSHLAKNHDNLGVCSYKSGKTTEALSAFRRALKIRERLARKNPGVQNYQNDLATSYRNLGVFFEATGESTKALEHFAKAANVTPRDSHNHVRLGIVLLKLKRYREAVNSFTTVIKLNPKYSRGYYYRGRAQARLSRFQLAKQDYARACRLSSTSTAQINSLAWLLATCPDESIRNGKLAVQLATRACKMTKWKSAKCLGTLAAAHAESGDFESAVKWQKEAQRLYSPELKERWAFLLELYNSAKPYRAPIPLKPPVRAPRPARIR